MAARGERLGTQWQVTEHLRSDAVLWLADHARCNELPRLLATAQGTGTPLEWSL